MKKAKIHPQIPYLRIIIRQITSMQLPQTSSFHTLSCCVRTIAFVIFISCWRTRHVSPHNPPPCIQIKCTYLADESLGGREGMSQQVICPEVSPLVEENGNTNVTRDTSQRFSNSEKPWATRPASGTSRIIPLHFRFKFCYTMSWLRSGRGTNLSMRFLCFVFFIIAFIYIDPWTTRVWTTQVHLYADFFQYSQPFVFMGFESKASTNCG